MPGTEMVLSGFGRPRGLLEREADMEVRFEVREDAHWLTPDTALVNVAITFGGHWVEICRVSVTRTERSHVVQLPRRKGGAKPAVWLSEELFAGVRNAAIDAFKAGQS